MNSQTTLGVVALGVLPPCFGAPADSLGDELDLCPVVGGTSASVGDAVVPLLDLPVVAGGDLVKKLKRVLCLDMVMAPLAPSPHTSLSNAGYAAGGKILLRG